MNKYKDVINTFDGQFFTEIKRQGNTDGASNYK